ncbi:SPOR domain-containing protein [Ornithinibacillus contaminans]|uniref:SPOR domain-containing protein n=1 Tax=Ornithinibacillus contaminans TaxID=694055 RepID=UPI00064DC38A|nr:SPOR domain-containing protein [Ornithinibacillus contaminans]
MSIKKPIVVRIDGKKASYNRSAIDTSNPEKITAHREVAAAEETSDTMIHTFARDYEQDYTNTKTQAKLTMFKPIIIAIISAIMIGSIMGIMMLKLMVNFDNNTSSNAMIIPANGERDTANENGESQPESSTNAFSLEAMSAFVLQGGVFSDSVNAESESAKFTDAGYTPIIWEKDNQFFLLVGVASTKEAVLHIASELQELGIDVYAKEWRVEQGEVDISKEEFDWLTSFQQLWTESLSSSHVESLEADWKQLLERAPSDSDKLATLITNLDGLQADLMEAQEQDFQHIWLAMWKEYEAYLQE